MQKSIEDLPARVLCVVGAILFVFGIIVAEFTAVRFIWNNPGAIGSFALMIE